MRISQLPLWFAILVIGTHSQAQQPPLDEFLVKQFDASNRLLFQLAAEKHAAVAGTNAIWIMTHHHGRSVRKYTDGDAVVVSLPVFQEGDENVLGRYAAQFNIFTEQFADRLVRSQKLTNAVKIYRLLEYFDRSENDLTKKRLREKLKCVAAIQAQKEIGVNEARFKELCEEVAPLLKFGQIESMTAVSVTNLMSLKLP